MPSSTPTATLVELIKHKRDGGELSAEQIRRLIAAHGSGELADYQMTALCMAIFFQGMTPTETAALTDAMLRSGTVIDLSGVDRPKVDKHSTGGVGDKVSICLAPLVAACGAAVPMISGRGLGHTGGTLDKLEAIPGFDVAQGIESFRRLVDEIGVAMIGRNHPLGIIVAAIFYGGLQSGARVMQLFAGIPLEMVRVVQGVIVLALALPELLRIFRFLRRRRVEIGGEG